MFIALLFRACLQNAGILLLFYKIYLAVNSDIIPDLAEKNNLLRKTIGIDGGESIDYNISIWVNLP